MTAASMARRGRTLLLIVAFALLPGLASAQSWLYLTLTPWSTTSGSGSTLVELPLTSSGLGSVGRQIPLPGRAGQAVVTSDGRYVVFTVQAVFGPKQLAIFDRRSGSLTVLPDLDFGAGPVSDPAAPRLFFFKESLITVIDAAGLRTIPMPAIDVNVMPLLSRDGRELFVARYRSLGPGAARVYHIAVLDPLTGVERRILPEVPEGYMASMALSHDGQRLVVAMNEPLAVRVLDAASGVELRSRGGPLPEFPMGVIEVIGGLHIDDRNNRLFLADNQIFSSVDTTTLIVLDASTLDVIANVSGNPDIAVDRTLGMVVTAGTGYSNVQVCNGMKVNVWNASPAPLASFTANVGAQCPSLTLATPPDAPSGMTYGVDGPRVTLSWSSVPGATGYAIEAGSTSGATDLARIETDQLTFDIAVAPPGTYFVRVHALNDVGASSASNEIVLTVP